MIVRLRPRQLLRSKRRDRPGDLVFKPRHEWHTFWNAGDQPARILEIIAPAGFERFFGELVDLGGVTTADPHVLGNLCARYGLEMNPGSVPGLIERFGLRFPGEPVTPRARYAALALAAPIFSYLDSTICRPHKSKAPLDVILWTTKLPHDSAAKTSPRTAHRCLRFHGAARRQS